MRKIVAEAYSEPEVWTENDSEPLVVHSSPNVRKENLVILIHGLTGHRYGYWGRMPEFLFEDFEDVDIGLYYYRTAWRRFFGIFKSIAIEDEAIVLANELKALKQYKTVTIVAHSMGGILAKLAIVHILQQDTRYQLKRINGLILIATPQLGSLRMPKFLRYFSRDGQALFPHNNIIQAIDGVFSAKINVDRRADPTNKSTLPCWAVVAAEDQWVDALSARIGIPSDQTHIIRGNHSTIKSPKTKEDQAYSFIRSCLEATFKPNRLMWDDLDSNLEISDATSDDVSDIRRLAVDFFGESVTPEHVMHDFAEEGGILHTVKRVIKSGGDARQRLCGYFCLIPLTMRADARLRAGECRGVALSMEDVAASNQKPHSVYVGAIAATDYYARGIVLAALKLYIKSLGEKGAQHFLTRPITDDGLRLAKKYNFKLILGEEGPNSLYMYIPPGIRKKN